MSNNRFLKPKEQNRPKEQNSRFQFLDKEDEATDTKKEKILSAYDSSNNSFMKPSNNFERPQNTRRDDNRRDDTRRGFKPRALEPVKVKVPEIIFTPELFPELIHNSNNSQDNIENSTNFKDILNTQIEPEIDPNKNNVEPGFVEITVVDNKFIMKHGPPTVSEIKMKANLEHENNVNYCMNNIVIALGKQWTKYKEEYDNLNGDGSYDELYCLPPVYGQEYDIDIEEETSDEQSHYEYDNDYDYKE